MFAKATKSVLSEIDTEGSLIPLSRLNDSDGLVPLSLVIKRNRYWFWQRPKYLPSDFKLNDVLVGDPINPVVLETDFLTYNGKLSDNKSGSAAAELGMGSINIGGSGFRKLQSSFGNLKKQELDVQKLLQDSKSRVLDLQHCLIQQIRETQREVLTVVKERIFTTQPCTITEDVQEGGTCTGMLGFSKTVKVSVNDKGKPFVEYDTNVSINTPPKTTIAYSVIELEVSNTGHYELCLLPDVKGGFEVDGPVTVKQAKTVSAAPGKNTSKLQKALHSNMGSTKDVSLSVLENTDTDEVQIDAGMKNLEMNLEGLQGQFMVLSKLPSNTRRSLFQQTSQLLQNSAGLSLLEDTLEDLCDGTQPEPNAFDEVPALKATLELIQKAAGSNSSGKQTKPSVISATHLLFSSLDEMPDSALLELKSCCSYATLQALLHLVQNMSSNKKSSSKDAALAVLADEELFKRITALFASCNVILLKEKDSLVTKIRNPQDCLPLMLCISVKALASLVPPV